MIRIEPDVSIPLIQHTVGKRKTNESGVKTCLAFAISHLSSAARFLSWVQVSCVGCARNLDSPKKHMHMHMHMHMHTHMHTHMYMHMHMHGKLSCSQAKQVIFSHQKNEQPLAAYAILAQHVSRGNKRERVSASETQITRQRNSKRTRKRQQGKSQ